jgi:hypothetical protein
MRGGVDLLQGADGHLGIDLRGLQVLVAEDGLDVADTLSGLPIDMRLAGRISSKTLGQENQEACPERLYRERVNPERPAYGNRALPHSNLAGVTCHPHSRRASAALRALYVNR